MNEVFSTYYGIVNKKCEKSKVKDLTEYQLKCLIFALGLNSHTNDEIRIRMLAKLENIKEYSYRRWVRRNKC